jgi:hypothetical protein
MKTRLTNFPRRSRGGSAVLVLLALLTVMLILIEVNTAALNRLEREVKGLEKEQVQRLAPSAKPQLRAGQTATNRPAARDL